MPRPAKRKLYYYECVYQVDMGYMAPDHRKERWPEKTIQPPMILHQWRFRPSRREGFPGDILLVDRPLASSFTETQDKIVRRKNLRTGEYQNQKTQTKVKFVLLDPEEVTESMKRKARRITLREQDYLEGEPVHAQGDGTEVESHSA